ncbi:alpha/beta hydrolase [Hyphomicrobium sp. CS1BSMeth3]|uniref:alpha/beta fold hydrolase n=1 Tax=Hyphomicrobium sp. CS1BSMeth3 TaxID=1892844 RepID=UPI000931C16E|nr:alpha/beta hydrolase [Hyphomicrobium sp. CS1BSMeth3]
MPAVAPLDDPTLPQGVRARFIDGVNGLRMHVLECGEQGRPCLLLLHGFPELAYSWRKVMPTLADAGYYVIAPDQRGYGRTTGSDNRYDADLAPFRPFNLVRDAVGLVHALGIREVASIIGHDFGATVAAFGSLLRPDFFRTMILMSAPFAGPPTIASGPGSKGPSIHETLAALSRPRKHYQAYYCTREANPNMHGGAQGVHAFLRAYFHHKSADWKTNKPCRLAGWTADELAKMPTYYIMDLTDGMAETVAKEMPSEAEIAACAWMPEAEMRVFSNEYGRTTFQGGLNWYRARIEPRLLPELELLSGRTIDTPSCFIAGRSDWGIYQVPGAIERMQNEACTRMSAVHLIEGAGHWVQQERPTETARHILAFLEGQR